jgi:aminoglycoside 3-N-acetyltransferase
MKNEKIQYTKFITQERLQNDIKNLGIKDGDHVALGVSYKSIGQVINGPRGLIDALLNVVGVSGTILVPTFTPMYPLSLVRNHKVPVFKKGETSSIDGVVSELIRTDVRAVRSSHPTNSFAAIGAEAEYLLKDHNSQAPSYSPYSKLAEIQGKLLIIGLDYRFIGLRHEAQYKAGLLTCIPPVFGALYIDDNDSVKIFVRRDLGGCVVRLPYMIHNLREADIVTDGNVGQGKAVVIPVREALRIMIDLLTDAPEDYLCGSSQCLWCREIERRLKINHKVPDKKWFHRYPFLRFFLDIYNYLRLRDVAAITLSKYYAEKIVMNKLRAVKIHFVR